VREVIDQLPTSNVISRAAPIMAGGSQSMDRLCPQGGKLEQHLLSCSSTGCNLLCISECILLLLPFSWRHFPGSHSGNLQEVSRHMSRSRDKLRSRSCVVFQNKLLAFLLSNDMLGAYLIDLNQCILEEYEDICKTNLAFPRPARGLCRQKAPPEAFQEWLHLCPAPWSAARSRWTRLLRGEVAPEFEAGLQIVACMQHYSAQKLAYL